MLFTLLTAALVAASPATASAATSSPSAASADAPLKLKLDTTLSTPTRLKKGGV